MYQVSLQTFHLVGIPIFRAVIKPATRRAAATASINYLETLLATYCT